MKKLFIVFAMVVSLFGFDWAGKVNWAMNYNVAKMLSQKTGKPIFVDLSLSHCPPCKYIAANMYTDTKIANFMNKHFICVLIIVDKQTVPEEVGQYFNNYTPSFMILKNGRLLYKFASKESFFNNKYNFLSELKKGVK